MFDWLSNIFDLFVRSIEIINQTCANINSINFEDTVFTDYLGYAKYVMGTPLYSLFSTVVLIAVGVTLWTWIFKGIDYLRNAIPFQ